MSIDIILIRSLANSIESFNMIETTHYEARTRDAYKTGRRAEEYKRYHTKSWNWSRISTWREQRVLRRELSRYVWTATDRLLDIPCGTGILGKLLHSFPFQIVASDISTEMMALATPEYPAGRQLECVCADITRTPFERNSFDCVVVLGFLHRVPIEIKRSALCEIFSLTRRVAIITCSVDSPMQRIKKRVLSLIKKRHVPAPCPLPLREIVKECQAAGFRVNRTFMVIPLFSSEAMFVLEKTEWCKENSK